jgi:hypothetical protein
MGPGAAFAAGPAPRLPVSLAAGVVIALVVPYTMLNFFFPGPVLTYALGLGLALIALGALWLAGLPPKASRVRLAPLSRRGGLVLAVLLLYLPGAVWLRAGRPWDWLDALVFAPASALGQELYFRGALLTALGSIGAVRGWRAVALQALAFGVWHLRAFRVVAPGLALVVLGGTCVVGALWGWQTRRDGTLVYALAQHTAFLIAA